MIVGIGIDVIEIKRIEKVGINRLAKRILTSDERDAFYFTSKRKSERLAGRFAAKEAIAKALGTGIGKQFSFHDIEIHVDNLGNPYVHLVRKLQANQYSDNAIKIHISITHSKEIASAFAVIEKM
jgi:holo-[acyl-carrier protein] synthase